MRIVARMIAGVFAVSWIAFPGFGAVDLGVTWSSDWPQVLEAGWGLFSTVIVGAAFVLLALRPNKSGPVALQLIVAAGALAISAAVADEGRLLALGAALALETALVSGLYRHLWRDGTVSSGRIDVSRPMLALASVAAIPWLVYARDMWALNREGGIGGDITIGIDHYSMQGALALSLALLSFLAALRADVRPFTSRCVGVAASYLGLVSLAWQDAAGGFGRFWSVAAIVWGIALVLAPLQPLAARRRARLRDQPQNV